MIFLVALLSAACGSSPTSPSPPPVVVVPHEVPPVVPFLTIQTGPCPTVTTGVDVMFYREMGCNALESPATPQPVRRWMVAPKVYLKTIDEAGAPMDALTLDTVQNAMIEAAPLLTAGRAPLEGVLRGTESRIDVAGWITVRWRATNDVTSCGSTNLSSDSAWIELDYKNPNCGCNGSAMRPRTARHELGHALGYWHTDSPNDLMSGQGTAACDTLPSARELQAIAFHYR